MSESQSKASIVAWGWTLSIFLLGTYVICVGFGLVMPDQFHMYRAWAPLLPGFTWLTWPGFFAGAIGSFLYGWYGAALLVPLYSYFSARVR